MHRWGDFFSGTGTVVSSLLSCAACPMCLPIYAGLLSLVGVELTEINSYFLPIMIGFACVTLTLMAYQIHTHSGSWRPFSLAIGALIGMGATTLMGFEYLLYLCAAFFIGSVIWNKLSLTHKGPQCC